MPERKIKVSVFRYDPAFDDQSGHQTYEVPWTKGMSAMDALDYIYLNLDSTLAYFDHAGCTLGICARCTGRINGKPGLLCQTIVTDDVVLDPLNESRVVRDLVVRRDKQDNQEKTNG
jgi:succinate dehydrogenase/fumarate reductase-like Fe-S protein